MKKSKLDRATIEVMRRMLNAPPKPHDEIKVGRATKKKRGTKGRASFAKRRSA